MRINFTPIKYNNYNDNYNHRPKLKDIAFDTVSFSAMTKAKFKGFDLLAINALKAPIQSFNSNQDLQDYCKKEVKNILQKDFMAKSFDTYIQRREILEDWCEEMLEDKYSNSQRYIVFDAITKPLGQDDETLPIVLHKGVLEKTLLEIEESIKDKPRAQINFLKIYKKNLKEEMLKEMGISEKLTGWIIIPSKAHDEKNFTRNVEILKLLSHHNWCTKSFNAEPYLKQGDLHIYFEDGLPRLCARFKKDTICEIQGEKNNSCIPHEYLNSTIEYIKGKKYSSTVADEVEKSKIIKDKIKKLNSKISPKAFEDITPKEIFEMLDINVEEDNEGFLTISSYYQPFEDLITFEDLGIDENKIFEKVKAITGTADFRGSKIKSLKNLQFIGKDAYFSKSEIRDLGLLKIIGGNAHFQHSNIENLQNLEFIGKDAFFANSRVKNKGKLKYIGGNMTFNEYLKKEDFDEILNSYY